MIEGPPYVLQIRRNLREIVRDEEGTYPSLIPDIEEWAMDNLQRGWTVHIGSRKPTEEEKQKLTPELHDITINHSWIEFADYKDWLHFKLRWCDR